MLNFTFFNMCFPGWTACRQTLDFKEKKIVIADMTSTKVLRHWATPLMNRSDFRGLSRAHARDHRHGARAGFSWWTNPANGGERGRAGGKQTHMTDLAWHTFSWFLALAHTTPYSPACHIYWYLPGCRKHTGKMSLCEVPFWWNHVALFYTNTVGARPFIKRMK